MAQSAVGAALPRCGQVHQQGALPRVPAGRSLVSHVSLSLRHSRRWRGHNALQHQQTQRQQHSPHHCGRLRVHAQLSPSAGTSATGEAKGVVPPGSVSVVLLSGGVGKRMGAAMPKQYLPLLNQPIATHSLLTFAAMPEVSEIVVVCEPEYRHIFQDCFKSAPKTALKFALPGKERQDSVYSGLQCIEGVALLVAVHDSARPLVSQAETRAVLLDALEHGAAVLGVKCKATIKEADSKGFVARTLDRNLLWEMQTPQVMRPQLLRDGFELVRERGLEVTDDVSIVEHLGQAVKITEGRYTNIKVTTPDDMLVAEKLMREERDALLATATAA